MGMIFPELECVVALSLGDLIEIVDYQTYLGEAVLNVYYYLSQNANVVDSDYLESLSTAFTGGVLAAVTELQVEGLLHANRTIKNLSNGVDFFVDTDVVTGQIAAPLATYMPSYVSAGFMLVRSNLNTRNGYKRFSGLTEGNVQGNDLVSFGTSVDDIEDSLAQELITLLSDTFIPVIVKRPIPAPGGADAITNPISSSAFRGIGTQNTRKPGRGI